MQKRLLDTSVLIREWRRQSARLRGPLSSEAVIGWARQLIRIHQTRAIASPVLIEFLAGTQNTTDLRLAKAFLDEFEVVDQKLIPPRDWDEAQRLAQRVPKDGSPRQLGDCLIRAVANRLHYDVMTHDDDFV
jgi:predicted nucleic acid-binding protein